MKKLFSFIGASFLVALTTVITYASIPAPNGTINGCYTTQIINGVHGLGVVDSTGTCPAGTIPINWSQTGPKGDTGATGPQGPTGIPNTQTFVDNNDQTTITAQQWNKIAPLTGSISITVASGRYILLTANWTSTQQAVEGRFIVDGIPVVDGGISGSQAIGNAAAPLSWPIFVITGTHTITLQGGWFPSGCTGCTIGVSARFLTVIDLGS